MTKTTGVRVDREWEERARNIMKERLDKKLANFNMRDLGLPEYTRLQLKCPSWNAVEKELRNLPKKPKGEKNGR